MSASRSMVQACPGSAWMAVIAPPTTGSMAPVSQPGAASGPMAQVRNT